MNQPLLNKARLRNEIFRLSKQLHTIKEKITKNDLQKQTEPQNQHNNSTQNHAESKSSTFYQKLIKQSANVKITSEIIDVYTQLLATSDYTKFTIEDVLINVSNYLCRKHLVFTLEAQEFVSKICTLLKIYPYVLLDLVTAIPDPPDRVKKLLDSHLLLKPTQPLKKGFNYDADLKTALDGGFRYMFNMPVSKVIEVLEKKHETKDDQYYNAKLFLSLSYQSRWGNLWIQIISSLIWCDTVTEANALSGTNLPDLNSEVRYATDLVSIQTIAYILKKFSSLPFFPSSTGAIRLVRDESFDWPTTLVPLLYSLLELSKEEKGCNYTKQDVTLAIEMRCLAAQTSFEESMLENKSTYTNLSKLVTHNLGSHVRILSNPSGGVTKTIYCEKIEEYFLDGELDNIKATMGKLYQPFITRFEQLLKLLNTDDAAKNTETARYILMLLQNISNPGIYYKTSLTLEKQKSVGAQYHSKLNPPKPTVSVVLNGLLVTLHRDWNTGDSCWKEIFNRFSAVLDKTATCLSLHDPQEVFVDFLTHKSQGAKVPLPEHIDSSSSLQRQRLLLSVTQARVAAFLLDITAYYSPSIFLERLQQHGICTVRFQNNRRARIVEIVPNVDQTAYALVLQIFNEHKKFNNILAVGKQQGGIIDMSLILSATCDQNTISLSSDIVGMDASTQQMIGVVFVELLASYLEKHPEFVRQYFVYKDDAEVEFVNANSQDRFKQVLNGMSRLLLTVIGQRATKSYKLKDAIFGIDIDVNSSIFESGRYDTSSQHTTLLAIVADIIAEKIPINTSATPTIYARRFGDDSYTSITSANVTHLHQAVNEYIRLEQYILKQFGFELEASVSRFFGDFLQQMGFCGIQVPKSARSSVYCDERGDTKKRDFPSQMKVIASVFQQASQRTYAPENVVSITKAAFCVMRTILIPDKDSENFLMHLPYYSDDLVKFGSRLYFSYPLVSMFLKPLNLHHNIFQLTKDWSLPETGMVTPVGDINLLIAINSVLSLEEKNLACRSFQEKPPHGVKIGETYLSNYTEEIFSRLWDANVIKALSLMNYSRSTVLSDNRKDTLAEDIQQMSSTLQRFYNQTKVLQSHLASVKIKESIGITLPDSITYSGQARYKINTMFASLTESTLEITDLNADFTRHMCKITNKKKQFIQYEKQIRLLTIFFNLAGRTKYEQNWFEVAVPLVPGYRPTSEYGIHINSCGSSIMRDGNVTKVQTTLSQKYGKAFDMETALKIGTQIIQKQPALLNDYMSALAVPDSLRSEFSVLIQQSSKLISADLYSSSFSPAEHFAISGSDALVTEDAYDQSFSQRTRQVLHVIARDLSLVFGAAMMTNKVQLSVSNAAILQLEEAKYFQNQGLRTYS